MEKILFKLEMFEGPLELLMHLIQKNKVNIYDIPIADITEQYIDYLRTMKFMDLEVSSEFLVMAAHLLYIKSRLLLPSATATQEQDAQDVDPRQDLVYRLLEYQKYKEASKYLSSEYLNAYLSFYRPPGLEAFEPQKTIEGNLSVQLLIKAVENMIVSSKQRQPPPRKAFDALVGREKLSVKDSVIKILEALKKSYRITFNDIFKNLRRNEIVADFLAVLELIKFNKVVLEEESDCVYLCYIAQTDGADNDFYSKIEDN